MAKFVATHERLTRDETVTGSSDRTLGFVFAVVLGAIGLWPLIGAQPPVLWALGMAAAFGAIAALRPAWLGPLNRLWTKLGLILHRVVNPVVMALLFYLTITPFALVMRLFGKDPLKLRFEPDRKSYWIERDPPGPAPDTMKRQF